MSRRLDGGSNVAAVLEVADVLTEAPARPAPEQGGSS
jgi:Zn-dependent M28 family amino/carboxypeptidase